MFQWSLHNEYFLKKKENLRQEHQYLTNILWNNLKLEKTREIFENKFI